MSNEEIKYVEMGFVEFINLCNESSVIKLEEMLMYLTVEHKELDTTFGNYSGLLIEMQEKGEFDYLNDQASASLIGSMGCALYYLRRIEEQMDLIRQVMRSKVPDCFKQ